MPPTSGRRLTGNTKIGKKIKSQEKAPNSQTKKL